MTKYGLTFWVDEHLVSKFTSTIVPQSGQVWHVPMGEHKLEDAAVEQASLRVIDVEISPISDEGADIDVFCEYVVKV